MSGNPICRDTACAMNKSGQCCALRDNTFKNRARCPFFKTKEQIDAELEARRERLAGLPKEAVGAWIERYYKKIY